MEKIVNKNEIMTLKSLLKKFTSLISQFESTDTTAYQSTRLKKRLAFKYPNLMFHKPSNRSESEIVYISDCNDLLSLVNDSLTENTEESDKIIYLN